MKHLWTLFLLATIIIPSSFGIEVELLSTSPAPLQAGTFADITFRVTIDETDQMLSDVTLTVQDTRFITQSSNPRVYSRIQSGDQVTTTLRVFISENTPEGFINLNSELSYNQATIQTNHEVYVEEEESEAALYIGTITTTPNTLLPDTNDNQLTITLQNLGDKNAELITADLLINEDFAKPSFAYAQQDSLAQLGSGESGELTFTIDIEEGTRSAIPALLDVRYRTRQDSSSAYNTYTDTLSFEIPIDDAPYLTVTAITPQGNFIAGTTDNVLRYNITNTGEEEAEDVRVRLFPDISYPFVFERTSQYIGANIQPGETVTGEFTFEIINSAEARDYPISIDLESIVGTTRYTQDDVITITITQEQQATSAATAIAIIAAIIIASLMIGIFVYRRRKHTTKKK